MKSTIKRDNSYWRRRLEKNGRSDLIARVEAGEIRFPDFCAGDANRKWIEIAADDIETGGATFDKGGSGPAEGIEHQIVYKPAAPEALEHEIRSQTLFDARPPGDKSFVELDGVYSDFSQGLLKHTGRSLDLAIEGKVYFEVLNPDGTVVESAREGGWHVETLIVSHYEPSDFAGLPVLTGDGGVTLAPPQWAQRLAAHDGPAIAFFDDNREQTGFTWVGPWRGSFDWQKVVDTLGADILRLWVAATDYSGELSISREILKRVVGVDLDVDDVRPAAHRAIFDIFLQ